MTIQVWAPGDEFSAQTILCRSEHADELRAAVLAKRATVTAFQVTPNGEIYIELLRSLLALRHDANWIPDATSSLSLDTFWIVRNLQRLAHGLSKWDDSAAAGAINHLLSNEDKLHPQQVSFVRFCDGLVSKVLRRMLWGSPMLIAWPPVFAATSWWQLGSDLATEIATQIADLKASFHGKPPAAVQGLTVWLGQVQSRLSLNLVGTSREDALVEGSALSAALARIHFSGSRYSLSTVFCHRAADLLFTSRCSSDGLIDWSKANGDGELKIAVAASGKKMLSLLQCHDAMVQAGTLLPDTVRRTTLKNLNSTRNRLLLTHGMGSPTQSDTKNELPAVVTILKSFGGTNWTTAYAAYSSGLSLSPTSLFEVSDGLMQTLQPI